MTPADEDSLSPADRLSLEIEQMRLNRERNSKILREHGIDPDGEPDG